GRAARRPGAPTAHLDDGTGHGGRALADGAGPRRRDRGESAAGDRGHRRAGGLHALYPPADPTPVRDLPGALPADAREPDFRRRRAQLPLIARQDGSASARARGTTPYERAMLFTSRRGRREERAIPEGTARARARS